MTKPLTPEELTAVEVERHVHRLARGHHKLQAAKSRWPWGRAFHDFVALIHEEGIRRCNERLEEGR